ncbi:MAG: 5-oxoprolinase/urea amidolyase family protein [Mesorhizobium sp.]
MRFLPVRAGRILVELPDLETTLALLASLENEPIAGISELIPAARTLLVAFDPGELTPARLVKELSSRDISASPAVAGPLVEIPVRYDGEDIAEVAALLGISEAEVVQRHTGADYTVAFTGFAPGFAYLTGGDPLLDVPRRKTPRTQVPAGAVGLAGTFSGVYPKTSPGGWQLIGSTPLDMFDLERDPAAILQPGYRVRFVDMAGSHRPTAIAAHRRKAPRQAARKEIAAAQMHVLDAAFPVLFQDLGRPGQASQGVSISGAADKASLKAANRLVGNPPGAAALEITFGGLRFRMEGAGVMALTGAPASIAIEAANGATLAAANDAAVALEDGDTVSVGAPARGLRSYLALRGGFAVEPVLGSASSDTLAQIGPRALSTGDRVDVLAAPVGALVSTAQAIHTDLPKAGEVVTLDVTLGPRTDWFTPQAVAIFMSQDWEVTPQSSRVGIRLKGTALERSGTRELPSEATMQGAIQVPASGQPVLFLADHPLTGGYPVIANVAAHHLDLAGQVPIGAKLRFNALGPFAEIGAGQ